jgi:dienelactone hydrolase
MYIASLPARAWCAALWLSLAAFGARGLATTAGPAPEVQVLTAGDGQPLHVARYRPAQSASTGVVLIHDWATNGTDCWGELPSRLCAAGFEVLVPDLREHGASVTPGMLHPVSTAPSRAELALLASDAALWSEAFSDSVGRVVVAGVGWGGTLAPRVGGPRREVVAVAWLGPLGDPAAFVWRRSDPTRRGLLLVASTDDLASSRVAESIYTRFNDGAELRLYSRGAGHCALLKAPDAADGLVEWVQGFAPGGLRP